MATIYIELGNGAEAGNGPREMKSKDTPLVVYIRESLDVIKHRLDEVYIHQQNDRGACDEPASS